MIKKVVSLILILSILFTAVVPSFAVGESLAISGLGSLAAKLGFASINPVLGILVALLGAGLALTAAEITPAIVTFVQNHFTSSMESNFTALGSVPDTPVSSEVASAVNDYVGALNLSGLSNFGISNTISLGYTTPDRPRDDWGYSTTEWVATNIPGWIMSHPHTFYQDGNNKGFYFNVFDTINKLDYVYIINYRFSSYTADVPCTFSLDLNSSGNVVLNSSLGLSAPTPSYWNQYYYNSAVSALTQMYGSCTPVTSSASVPLVYYPNAGYNTYAQSNAINGTLNPVVYDGQYVLTDETVISIPQNWEYDSDDDVLTVPDVGILSPGLVYPGISGGSLAWEGSPQWQDDSPDLPTWTYRIPLLSTIVKFLNWIGSLIKTLGDWLASLWESITGFFADVGSFFADCRIFFHDLLELLRGSDLARFISAIFGFLSGYTLYQSLFTAYLPQCIAAVLWAGWLCLMAFWVLRLVLNR